MKQGQGAATAAPEPIRTPERQALADAIAERDRLNSIASARRNLATDAEAAAGDARTEHYIVERDLENLKQDPHKHQRERTEALLRGEEPPANTEVDDLRARLPGLKDAYDKREAEAKQARIDVEEVEKYARYAQMSVDTAVVSAIHADPATLAVAEAFVAARERYLRLQHALGGALSTQHPGKGPPSYLQALHFPSSGRTVPPCLWKEATARLQHDPDAAIPMPDAV